MSKKKQQEQEAEILQETETKNEPAINIDALQSELSEKTAKCDEYIDKYQRLAAEFDNYRKRTIKEREQIQIDSVAQSIETLLPVMDNLERALSAVANEPDSSVKQGLDLIARQLIEAFEKIGVTPIETAGAQFDPNLHNAVMHVEDDSVEANIIVEEFQKGYIYKEKVIRHSMVKVAN